jgi:hypothetical protein
VNLGQVYLLLAAKTWEQAASAATADSALRRNQALRNLLASEALAGPAASAAR